MLYLDRRSTGGQRWPLSIDSDPEHAAVEPIQRAPSFRQGLGYHLAFEGASDFASSSPLISSARVTLSATIVQIAPDIR